MPAFIVTLGTMLIYRSIAQFYLRTMGLSIYSMDASHPTYDAIYGFGQAKICTVPVVGIMLLIITAVMVYLSTMTKLGKRVYAIGSNEKAAHLAGINVTFTRVMVYVITGILAGIAAFLWLAMNGSVDPATIGKSYEMYAIAAVVIGGNRLRGGQRKPPGGACARKKPSTKENLFFFISCPLTISSFPPPLIMCRAGQNTS